MNLADALSDAARYPFRGQRGWRRSLVGGAVLTGAFVTGGSLAMIGGGLFYFGILLLFFIDDIAIVLFSAIALGIVVVSVAGVSGAAGVVQGYLVEATRSTFRGSAELPPWKNPYHLISTGLRSLPVTLFYLAVSVAAYAVSCLGLLWVLYVSGWVGGDVSSPLYGAPRGVVEFVGGGLGEFPGILSWLATNRPLVALSALLICLPVGYLTAASLAVFASEDSTRVALSAERIRAVGFVEELAVAALVGTGVLVVLGTTLVATARWLSILVELVLGSPVAVLGLIVGSLVGFVGLFAVLASTFRLVALGYATEVEAHPVPVAGGKRDRTGTGRRQATDDESQ